MVVLDDGGSAFPRVDHNGRQHRGMSLRDYFAGQTLGSIATHALVANEPPQAIAATCYLIADAMLKARGI